MSGLTFSYRFPLCITYSTPLRKKKGFGAFPFHFLKFLLCQCNIFLVEAESHCSHSSNEFYLTFAWIFSFSLCKHLLSTYCDIFLSNYCKLNTGEQKQMSAASVLVCWTWQAVSWKLPSACKTTLCSCTWCLLLFPVCEIVVMWSFIPQIYPFVKWL